MTDPGETPWLPQGQIGDFLGVPVMEVRRALLPKTAEDVLNEEIARAQDELDEANETRREIEELKAQVNALRARQQGRKERTFLINAEPPPAPRPFPRPEFTGPTVTAPRGRAFQCPVCNARSHNPNDLIEGYCAACNQFTCNHRRCCTIHGTHTTPHMGCVMR